jgi:nucleotide-binding universal stress UspA family protein
VKRWLLGSVAERVVRLAPCSVLVTRGEAPAGGYQRVVIGTDFSASATRAVEHALPLLAPEAEVKLIHSWPGPWAIPEAAIVAYDSMRSAVLDQISDASRRLTATLRERGREDVRVEGRSGEAPPAVALTEAATELHADLVVVGSHGRRGVRRFLLGSVAEVTVRHAPCSVLVSR